MIPIDIDQNDERDRPTKYSRIEEGESSPSQQKQRSFVKGSSATSVMRINNRYIINSEDDFVPYNKEKKKMLVITLKIVLNHLIIK